MTYHRVVDKEVATKFAKENKLKYMETSAKDGTGVNELFQYIAETAAPNFLEAKMELEEKQKQNLVDLEKKKNDSWTCYNPVDNVNRISFVQQYRYRTFASLHCFLMLEGTS